MICDERSARIEVTNNGAGAMFSASLSIKGPVKAHRTTGLYCQWEHTPSSETRIAKNQTCRLIVAEQHHEGPSSLPSLGITVMWYFTWWVIHAIADGIPFETESSEHSSPFSEPPAAADDITLDIEIVANPDLIDGVQHRRITLQAFKAVAE